MAFWLLSGGTGRARVDWLSRQGFQALSLLINDPDAGEGGERRDTASAIRDSGLLASCHTNYERAVRPDGTLDLDRLGRLHDQVLWWHAHTGGVYSACADPIVVPASSGAVVSAEINRDAMRLAAEAFGPAGIRFGWENTFGPPDRCRSAQDINGFAETCGLPGLGLLLDLGHLNIHLHSDCAPVRDPERFIRDLAVPVHEVHVTDNLGERDEHRHLGYGNLDLEAAMRGLRAVGFCGPLVVEVCVDILSGRYAADIHDPAQTAPILATRDRLAVAARRFFPR